MGEKDNTASMGGKALSDLLDDDVNADEEGILGTTTISTIGQDFRVPRSWLVPRMEELGIAQFTPRKVTPKRAFNRMRSYLLEDDHDTVQVAGKTCELTVEEVDTRTFHVEAKAYERADDEEIGEIKHEDLGVIQWVDEHQQVATTPVIERTVTRGGKTIDHPFRSVWENVADRARDLHTEMMEHNLGRDIQRQVLYKFTHGYSSAVKIRDGGAVYFVPAHQDDTVRAIQTLIEEIDERYKHKGHPCTMRVIPVIDNENQREMVSERAGVDAERQVSNALDDAFDRMEDAEDDAVSEIVDSLADDLGEVDDFVGEYNALLNAEMSVREILDGWIDQLKGEQQDIAEKAADVAEDEGAIA